MTSFPSEVAIYVGRVREFERQDWLIYILWVGLIFGLTLATGGFVAIGVTADAPWPAEAFMVPIGAAIFATSIAVDTIGHRTIYKKAISKGEGLVHHITIFCGIGSCVLLCAAYSAPSALWIPAMVLTILSFVYSLVDEVFHWRRYVMANADRVEMWSHVGILVGHGVMMIAWWACFFRGYPGVAETLAAMKG